MTDNTAVLTILMFACPSAWLGAVSIWIWRYAAGRPPGKVPLVFCALFASHLAGFLCVHTAPYRHLNGGRDYIYPLCQVLLGGAFGLLFAFLLLPAAL